MSEETFEGTLVLESLARIGKLEDFFAAIDSDNFSAVKDLMTEAGVDPQAMAVVLAKMADPYDEP